MFKKRAKKVAGEGDAAAQEREEFPGWNEASQEVRDWWISLEALNQNDSEFLPEAIRDIRFGQETITGLWEAWTKDHEGRPLPKLRPENLRTELWSVITLARKRRQLREKADLAGRLDADRDRSVREKLGGDEAGEHAREWWKLFRLSAFLDPAGFIDLLRVAEFLREIEDRQASITEAYLAWVHTEDGKSNASAAKKKLLAYLDQHRDELRREAAHGGDDVPISKHLYLWKKETLRKGIAYYHGAIAKGASPEATEWWSDIAEKYRDSLVALLSLVSEVDRQGAALDELHAAGTAVKWDTIEALHRTFEGRAAGRALTNVGTRGTLGSVDPSKTQRSEINTPEGQGLEALKPPAYLTEAERASLATIAKLLDEPPRLACLVRAKCDEVSPTTEDVSATQQADNPATGRPQGGESPRRPNPDSQLSIKEVKRWAQAIERWRRGVPLDEAITEVRAFIDFYKGKRFSNPEENVALADTAKALVAGVSCEFRYGGESARLTCIPATGRFEVFPRRRGKTLTTGVDFPDLEVGLERPVANVVTRK